MARANEATIITGKMRPPEPGRSGTGRPGRRGGISPAGLCHGRRPAPLGAQGLPVRKMVSGTVRNAVSGGSTVLEGSLRTYREETFRFCREELEAIGRHLAAETGCGVEVSQRRISGGVEPRGALAESLRCPGSGCARPSRSSPALAAEDFSFYQQAVPGVFFFLGAGNTPEWMRPTLISTMSRLLPQGLLRKSCFSFPTANSYAMRSSVVKSYRMRASAAFGSCFAVKFMIY